MTFRFKLAPMSALMWILTLVCFAIPVIMVVAAARTPVPVRPMLFGVAGLIVAIYVFITVYLRPIAFVIEADGLDLVWPVRQRRIDASSIVGARVLDMAELKQEFGYLMRIGAGGLWGGFGLAKTARGTLELWVSRTDRIVLVECEGRRSLLITPEDPDRFVRELPKRAA
jgi:hypothetical protein